MLVSMASHAPKVTFPWLIGVRKIGNKQLVYNIILFYYKLTYTAILHIPLTISKDAKISGIHCTM